MSTGFCYYVDDEVGEVLIRTPYEEGFVAELKEQIPPPHRKWDPDLKVWKVEVFYLDLLLRLCQQFLGAMPERVEKMPPPLAPKQRRGRGRWRFMELDSNSPSNPDPPNPDDDDVPW